MRIAVATAILAACTLGSAVAAAQTTGGMPGMPGMTPAPTTSPSPEASGSPSSTTAPSPAASAAAVVHMKGFTFAPATVTISAGQTVRFLNDDVAAHTVTASDKSYDSGDIAAGASWSHRYDAPGTYPYICAYHPFMKATIVVK